MKQSDGVAWGVTDKIGRIVLTRPESANSLTRAATRALATGIDEVLECQPRVVLLAAQGSIFCCGGDINEFVAAGSGLDELVDDILVPLHGALHRLVSAPVPVVSALNGPIAGAGVGLALCADFVLGAVSLKLRTGYAAIGLSPDLGASYFLARRVGAVRAQQWLMLSDTIDAERCLQYGVVDALHPDAELEAAADNLAKRLALMPAASVSAIKTLCSGLPGRSLEAHLSLEHELLVGCSRSVDAVEGLRAFVEKRPPQFNRS
ncbi:enoyl-CoA hydratase-related protein [Paraburkholderia sediminicola]|uniref:enoyl-CoA hydratase-related protein n=1 Tax=Paraburkholderia sediminicola TaxID=458836 RepID=UPI0038BC566E